ncbi:histone-lysine N-methyltransferase SETMAR-like [Centruroides sculpturatus]|uniref:histone-lysine N-methyltransferase SETMAR-like n=1 Tax=Centruroides sculpturatus TaxID=218467 RepID=UPI000C6EB2D6|nr:histone-lysine N-methyltransferase SETMAR-like [Centruroides sculpturatus]
MGCSCLRWFGPSYNNGLLIERQEEYDRFIVECNSSCSCTDQCPNRVVQWGIQFNFCIFDTSNKGFGVKTLHLIKKHKFVCEYAGEILTRNEAIGRFSLNSDDNNYIIVVNEHIGSEKKIETIVDPRYYGNVGRFLNHSCNPNLFMIPVRTNSVIPKLCLFASRDILPLEELCYDYSGGIFSSEDSQKYEELIKSLKPNQKTKKCLCESHLCKGMLPYDPFLFK